MVANSKDTAGLLFISGYRENEKDYFIFYMICIILITPACTKHTLYFTPEVVGYLYDSKTKKPFVKKVGEMGFNGRTNDEDAKIKLNKDGGFVIPAVSQTYYFIKPNTQKYTNFPSEIFISFKGYEFRSFDYSSAYVKQVPEGKSNFNHYKKIDLGVIYLDPKY